MYEEVEINTPLELARHLINEGDLYVGKDKARIGVDKNCTKGSPFVVFYSPSYGTIYMSGSWAAKTHTYYRRLDWRHCIPEGKKVPCYVSDVDSNPDNTNAVDGIVRYCTGDPYPYKAEGAGWKYATPISADELWIPEV